MPKTGQKVGRSILIPTGMKGRFKGTFLKTTKKGYDEYKKKGSIDGKEFRGHYYGSS